MAPFTARRGPSFSRRAARSAAARRAKRASRLVSLKARHVIHTVGPVWNGGEQRERELLASAYECSLDLATTHGFRTLAFPSISTGAYRFPLDEAARIALETTAAGSPRTRVPEVVTFVCFGEESRARSRSGPRAIARTPEVRSSSDRSGRTVRAPALDAVVVANAAGVTAARRDDQERTARRIGATVVVRLTFPAAHDPFGIEGAGVLDADAHCHERSGRHLPGRKPPAE